MRAFVLPVLALACLPLPTAAKNELPLRVGDEVHGAALLDAASAQKVRVEGNWLNRFGDEEAVAAIASGKDGFPKLPGASLLDRYDVLERLKRSNTDVATLQPSADHALYAEPALDGPAVARLGAAGIRAAEGSARQLFTLYRLSPGQEAPAHVVRVPIRNSKKRDLLKPSSKVGYVVFMPLPGVRGGDLEVALSLAPNMVLKSIVVRAADGSLPEDLNQAARKYVGQGARGKYAALRAAGAGKAVSELAKPLSEAYLLAAEHVYMFEVDERDYFAFDD